MARGAWLHRMSVGEDFGIIVERAGYLFIGLFKLPWGLRF